MSFTSAQTHTYTQPFTGTPLVAFRFVLCENESEVLEFSFLKSTAFFLLLCLNHLHFMNFIGNMHLQKKFGDLRYTSKLGSTLNV